MHTPVPVSGRTVVNVSTDVPMMPTVASGPLDRAYNSWLSLRATSPSDIYREHCIYLPAMAGWFFFSALLSSYNKIIFGETHLAFPCPLFLTSMHFGIQWGVSWMLTACCPVRLGADRVTSMTWREWAAVSIPCGMVTSGDVGLSNLSLVSISITFYTMVKSSTPIFVLMSAFLFGLERIRWSLIGVVAIICGGEFLTVLGEVDFSLRGFLLCLGASILSGLRWTLVQVKLQKLDPPIKSTIATMRLLAPSMCISMLAWSALIEKPWTKLNHEARIAAHHKRETLVQQKELFGILNETNLSYRQTNVTLWRVIDDFDRARAPQFENVTEHVLSRGKVPADLFYDWVLHSVEPAVPSIVDPNETLVVLDEIPSFQSFAKLPADSEVVPPLWYDLIWGGLGGFLAVAMILCEFYLILHANAIILMIGGVIKEMITIGMGVFVFGDVLNGVNAAGCGVVFCGVIVYKVIFHLEKKQALDETATSDNNEEDARLMSTIAPDSSPASTLSKKDSDLNLSDDDKFDELAIPMTDEVDGGDPLHPDLEMRGPARRTRSTDQQQ